MVDDARRADREAKECDVPVSSAVPLPEVMGSPGSAGDAHLDDGAQAGLDKELDRLIVLDLCALRTMWSEACGSDAPPRLGTEFLRRAMAYHRQEQALGGLSRQLRLRLKALQRQCPGNNDSRRRPSETASIKAGTRFVREWQGQVHEVQAIENGQFVHAGKTYRSLTLIAREITGTHQSGPRFFGLKVVKVKRPVQKRQARRADNG